MQHEKSWNGLVISTPKEPSPNSKNASPKLPYFHSSRSTSHGASAGDCSDFGISRMAVRTQHEQGQLGIRLRLDRERAAEKARARGRALINVTMLAFTLIGLGMGAITLHRELRINQQQQRLIEQYR